MNDKSKSITFVTSFFDIGRNSDSYFQNFENYFNWIKQLLDIPINIYFFTSPELHDRFKYTPRSSLIFKFISDIPYFDKLNDIKETWKDYITDNPTKDTPEFAAITHAKFNFLCQAIMDDPFGDSHYSWIDAGILKIATNPELLPEIHITNKIKCMMLRHVTMDEINDINFIKTCRYKFAAGLFAGPKELIRVFCLKMMAEAEYSLYNKRFGLEQEYMAIIYKKNPELFDLYYGSFCDLIINFNEYTNNCKYIESIFIESLKNGDRYEATNIAKYLVQSSLSHVDNKQMFESFLKTL